MATATTLTTADVRRALQEHGYRFDRDAVDTPIINGPEGTVPGRLVQARNAPDTANWCYPDIPRLALVVAGALKLRGYTLAREVNTPYRQRLTVLVRRAVRELAALAPSRYRVVPATPPAVTAILPDGSTASIQQHLIE